MSLQEGIAYSGHAQLTTSDPTQAITVNLGRQGSPGPSTALHA